jgi:hypothetical protein
MNMAGGLDDRRLRGKAGLSQRYNGAGGKSGHRSASAEKCFERKLEAIGQRAW